MVLCEFQNSTKSLYAYSNNDATYPAHFHTTCEVMYVRKGAVKVTVEGKTFIAHENEAIFIAPHQIHSYNSSHLIQINILFIHPMLLSEYAEQFQSCTPVSPIVRLENREENLLLLSLLDSILCIFAQDKKNGLPEGVSARGNTVRALGRAAAHLLLEQVVWEKTESRNTEATQQILDYCLKNYRSHLSIAMLSETLDINSRLITRIFANQLHISFRTYINSLRVADAAEQLISGTEPITKIAFSVGFDTLRTFNRVFLSEKGLSPSEFRHRYGKDTEQAEKNEQAET